MAYDYDLFVIGGGSGGVRAARRVGALGKKVAIAEESRYGGTCVVRGCVPKKLYVYASAFSKSFKDSAGYGWSVGDTNFDWRTLVDNKEAEITRLEGLYRQGLNGSNVDTFDTRAELRGTHEVWLKNEDRVVTAERIIVAVGGTPNRMETLEGAEHTIVSDDAFDLQHLPKSIVINGAGYIAVEFAGIFHGLGVDTTLVYRGPQILKGFDEDVRTMLRSEFENSGLKVITEQEFEKIELTNDDMKNVHLSGGDILCVDEVFQAVGRKPKTEGLGLELAGVETDRRGNIIVNEYSRTNVDSIWALGDVTDRVQLTPVAIHEAMCFVSTEYQNEPQRPDHEMIATAVFSQPEIGTVGLSEQDAAKMYPRLNVFKADFRPMKHTLSGRSERMLMKLIVDADSDVVVGAHIMGSEAGEMAQLLAIPMKMKARKSDFDKTMAVHPTASEEMVTMYEPSYTIENGERV